jgi:selenocysteine lyase/cysteine desulfurase
MGPTGTGALYIGPRVTIRPWREGGTGGDSKTEIQPTDYPYFLEGGTPNIMGISGLLAGIKWVTQQGIEKIHQHENALAKKLSEGIANLPGIRMLGHQDWSKKVATVSFTIEGLEPYEMGNILDSSFAIAIRPGLHCAPYIHGAQSTFPDGAVRASLGPFNTEEDINALIGALKEVLGA